MTLLLLRCDGCTAAAGPADGETGKGVLGPSTRWRRCTGCGCHAQAAGCRSHWLAEDRSPYQHLQTIDPAMVLRLITWLQKPEGLH